MHSSPGPAGASPTPNTYMALCPNHVDSGPACIHWWHLCADCKDVVRTQVSTQSACSPCSEGIWAVLYPGRGIGQAIAEAYAAEGASLHLCAHGEAQLWEVAKEVKAKGAREVNTHVV